MKLFEIIGGMAACLAIALFMALFAVIVFSPLWLPVACMVKYLV